MEEPLPLAAQDAGPLLRCSGWVCGVEPLVSSVLETEPTLSSWPFLWWQGLAIVVLEAEGSSALTNTDSFQ